MSVLIAIPEPTSLDAEYNQRSLAPYLSALTSAGATPILVPIHESQSRIARLLSKVQGILLPGSRYDIDPQRYGQARIPACSVADPARAAVDELLLQDGFGMYKPILGICHGMQTLNVWCNGSLIQDLDTSVNHRPGREVLQAHPVRLADGSVLHSLASAEDGEMPQVNSSHHQAVQNVGDNLLISAVSPEDGVIEAVELNSEAHFVLGVQWHPERTYTSSRFSRSIFARFVSAASLWQPRAVVESVVMS